MPEYFGFPVDVQSTLDLPVPAVYFGNCIRFMVAESTHGEIKGNYGFFVGAELIGELISKTVNKKEEILRDADDWLVKYCRYLANIFLPFGVVELPKFDLYNADFGWGKPKEFESVSIDGDSNISLCKSREFERGLEIGLSLPKRKIDAFAVVLSDGLKM